MALNIDKIEKEYIENFDIKYWNNKLTKINDLLNQFLNNEYGNKYLKYKINVKLSLNQNIENDPNAYSNKIDKNNFEIVFGRKLLLLLDYYSHEIFNYELIFDKIERIPKNEEKLYKLVDFTLESWIYFIFLHEWTHILNGHFEYESSSKNDMYIELDADITAGKILIALFASNLSDFQKDFQEKDICLIENFNIIMFYLFDFFFEVKEINIRNTHPSIHDRMIALLTTFTETFYVKNNLFKISQNEFFEIGMKSILKFMIYHDKKYKLNKNDITKDFESLTSGYFSFQKENSLNHIRKNIS